MKKIFQKMLFSVGYWIGKGIKSSFSKEIGYLNDQNNFHPIKIWNLDERKKSYEYFKKYFDKSMLFESREKIQNFSVNKACENFSNENYLFLEFGVFNGDSITRISNILKKYNKQIYGFDSFEGLSEDWKGFSEPKGTFTRNGKVPELSNDNIKIIKGDIKKTLKNFLNKNSQKIAFVHIDTDTYETAKYILENIKPRLVKNSIILFDELYNFYGWREGEFKALLEVFSDNEFNYIAFTNSQQVTIQIL